MHFSLSHPVAMRSLLLAFCLSFLFNRASSNVTGGGTPGLPGVKLHLTERGMRYLSSVAGEALNDMVNENSRIPNYSRDYDEWWGEGSISATETQLTQFNAPTYQYENRPPDRFVWKTNGGFAQVKGKWHVRYETWFITKNYRGRYTSETQENPRFQVSARFQKTPQGKLAATDIECIANLGELKLDIQGEWFSGNLLQFFRHKIADYIRPALERELCSQAKHYVSEIMNSHIGSHPFNKEFFPQLVADFRLTRNFVMNSDSIESWHKGWTFYKDRPNDRMPFHPHPLQRSGESSKMLYVLLSDYFFNSVLHQAHKYNISRFETDENTMKVVERLRPTCSIREVCLGTLFPQIEQLFGRRAKGHLSVYTTRAPTVIFKPGKAATKAQGYVQVYAVQGEKKTRMFGVLGSAEADVRFVVSNRNKADPRLVYNITITSLKIDRLDSDIDALNNDSIALFLNFSRSFIEKVINERLKSGIKIMVAEGARMNDAQVRVMHRTIEIGTDFVFYNDDGVL